MLFKLNVQLKPILAQMQLYRCAVDPMCTTLYIHFKFCISLFVGTVAMATANKEFVVGVVCRGRLSNDPGFIHMTPGEFSDGRW